MDIAFLKIFQDVFLSFLKVITRVKDTGSTVYGKKAVVKGVLGDGSKIRGTVGSISSVMLS